MSGSSYALVESPRVGAARDANYTPPGEAVLFIDSGLDMVVVVEAATLEELAPLWRGGLSLTRRLVGGVVERVSREEYERASELQGTAVEPPLTAVGVSCQERRARLDAARPALRDRFLLGDLTLDEYGTAIHEDPRGP